MKHIVMYSGGVGSWVAARRVAAQHGTDNLTLLFTDTLIEDADLYRFLIEGAANVLRRASAPGMEGLLRRAADTPPSDDAHIEARKVHLSALRRDTAVALPGLVWIADGRTPWELFAERRFLGNNRVGICSMVLKRNTADAWMAAHCNPATTICYVGIDWTEEHRFTRLAERNAKSGWTYMAPLCSAPYIDKYMMLEELSRQGIVTPRLYRLNFSHNNCGGGCVKAGAGHFAHLLAALPDVYAEWENREGAMRAVLGDVAILRERSGGTSKPLPLVQLRRRIEAGRQPDMLEIGGCGCFSDDSEASP
jgi:hypothetical protein